MSMNVALSDYKEGKLQKSTLYKIPESMTVPFEEIHANGKEVVNLNYQLQESQYGIYANEYKNPCISKQGCKKADVLACVVDDKRKKIKSLVFDVKSNISSFSNDLTKENAALTAIKEIRDFIDQIHAALLHKKSFMLYYLDEGFQEQEEVAIATKNFECEKFLAVADFLESIFKDSPRELPPLVKLKMQTILKPYIGEIEKIRNFADKMLIINEKPYPLIVIILEKSSESVYSATVTINI